MSLESVTESVSKIPTIHAILNTIPYPFISWYDVSTQSPTIIHLLWAPFFAIFIGLYQSLITYIGNIISIPLCSIDIDITKLYSDQTNSESYIKIIKHLKYNPLNAKFSIKSIDTNSIQKQTDLSQKDIKRFLRSLDMKTKNIEQTRRKFREALFTATFKPIIFTIAIYMFNDYDWIYSNKLTFIGWPDNQNFNVATDMKFFYSLHLGYYLYRTISSHLFDRRLKDYHATMIHHLVSIWLLVFSYKNKFIRVGMQNDKHKIYFPYSVYILTNIYNRHSSSIIT